MAALRRKPLVWFAAALLLSGRRVDCRSHRQQDPNRRPVDNHQGHVRKAAARCWKTAAGVARQSGSTSR